MDESPRERIWKRLRAAREQYEAAVPREYDEVLLDVAQRAASRGSLGKADIGALVVWKRLRADTRWASSFMRVPEAEVREITAQAVAKVRDMSLGRGDAAQQARELVWELPGFKSGAALASAVLTAAAPQRMAVYDRHAHRGVETLGYSLGPARGRYGRYMDLLDSWLSDDGQESRDWTARNLDTALYWLGAHGTT